MDTLTLDVYSVTQGATKYTRGCVCEYSCPLGSRTTRVTCEIFANPMQILSILGSPAAICYCFMYGVAKKMLCHKISPVGYPWTKIPG